MKQTEDSPMIVVGDVMDELRHLSSLILLLTNLGNTNVLKPEVVTDTMMFLWDYLDKQIKALDGIQWKPEKGRAAA